MKGIPDELHEFDCTAVEDGLRRVAQRKPNKQWLILRAQCPLEVEPEGDPEDDEERTRDETMKRLESEGRFRDFDTAGELVQNYIRQRVLQVEWAWKTSFPASIS